MFSTYLRQKKASKSHPVKMNRSIRYYKSRNEFINKSLSFVEYW